MDEEELGEKVKLAACAISEQMALIKKTAQIIKNQPNLDEKARQMFLHQSESICFTSNGKKIDAYGNIERPIQQLVGTTKADRIRECKLRFLDIVAQVEDGKIPKNKGIDRIFYTVEVGVTGWVKKNFEAYTETLEKGTATKRVEIFDAVTDALEKIESLPDTATQVTPKKNKELETAFYKHPQFKKHFPILFENRYILKSGNGYAWNVEKGSFTILAIYLGNLQNLELKYTETKDWATFKKALNVNESLAQLWKGYSEVEKIKDETTWQKEREFLLNLIKTIK